jgi:hypothetical protein
MGAAREAPSGAQGTTFALLAKAGTPLLSLAIFFLLFLFALRKESQLLSLSPAAAQAPVGALAAAAAAPPAQLCPCSQALVLDYFEIGTVRQRCGSASRGPPAGASRRAARSHGGFVPRTCPAEGRARPWPQLRLLLRNRHPRRAIVHEVAVRYNRSGEYRELLG